MSNDTYFTSNTKISNSVNSNSNTSINNSNYLTTNNEKELQNLTIDNKEQLKSSTTYNVNNYNQLVNAISDIKSNTVDTSYTINLQKNSTTSAYYITDSVYFTDSSSLTKNVTINGNGVTIDGRDKYQFMNISSSYSVNINDLIITNCNSTEGGVFTNYGNLTLNNITVKNTNGSHNGGISNYGRLLINNSTFTNNTGFYGGVIENTFGYISISNSTFDNNTGDVGGVIYNYWSDLYVYNVTFTNNYGNNGGVIYNYRYARTNIYNSTLTNNSGSNGGVLYNTDNSVLYINNTIFKNNDSPNPGSILTSYYNSVDSINNCTFENNSQSGTHLIYVSMNETIRINNSVFKDNSEILRSAQNSSVLIANSTFTNNTQHSNPSGILYILSTNITIENSTFESNSGILTYASNSNMTINSSIFTDNIGDLIYVNSGNVNITNNQFRENSNGYSIYNSKGIMNVSGNSISTTYTGYINQNTTINSPLQDLTLSSDCKITFNIDGTSVSPTIDSDGIISLDYIFTTNGEHNVTVVFDSIYDNNNMSVIVTTSQASSYIILNSINDTIFGYYVTISGTLYDQDDKTLANETIVLTINNETYTTTTNDYGYFTYNFNSTIGGNNNLTVTFEGDNNKYQSSSVKTTFYLIPRSTSIQINQLANVHANDVVGISGLLIDNYGIRLKNTNVTLSINGLKIYTTTDNNGTFEYYYTTTTVGTNNITATFEGNDSYNSSSSSMTFYVYQAIKIETEITINPISNVTIGKTLNITGTLKDINGNTIPNTDVEIAINDNNYHTITTNNNGEFSYNYITSVTGTNNITINFRGNDAYSSYSDDLKFNVTKILTQKTINQIETQTFYNHFTVYGTLKDIEGNALKNTHINLIYNGDKMSLWTDNNGEYSYKYHISTLDTIKITAEFEGNEYYSPSNASTSFDVIKMNSSITINPIENTTVGDRITISGKLNNIYGISYNEIIVDINGNTSTFLTASNGSFNIIYDTTTTGVNNITITFEGDDYSNPSTTTISFNVTKKNSELNISSIDEIYVNNPVTITGQLIGDDGKYLNHENVTITINQDQFVAETRSNGTYSLKYTPTIIGTNNVTISFEGSLNYTGSTIQTSFEVLKEASNIKIDQVTTKNGYNVTFKATITDEDGNPINSGQATFKLNGVTLKVNGSQVKVNVTDGLAQYTYTVPNYSAKEYKLTVVYGLTDVRLEDSTTLVILKSDPELKLTSITSNGTTGHITGMLLDEHGVGVDRETKVSVKISGKTILSTRIYEGVIDLEFDTSAYKSGVHNLTVIFGENGCYNTVTYEGAIAQNVKDIIVVNPVTGKNGDVVSFRAYIIDENGNSATNGSATFKLNGVTVKENGTQIKVNFVNGVAEYNFTIPDYSAKDYNLTAVASVDGIRYEAQSVLTIEKTDTHVQLNPITITQGSNATVTGSILDERNNPITIDTKVSVKINGKTVSNTRVYDGLIDVPIDTSSYSKGNYTIDFVAGENGRYNKSTGSTTLTINKPSPFFIFLKKLSIINRFE